MRRELLAHAASLGVTVHVAHIDGARGFYDADRKMAVYGFDLTPIEQVCVLAHELGHAYYDHRCRGDQRAEDDADFYAACLLIDPHRFRAAARINADPAAIADELDVEERLVRVYKRRALTRLGDVTYVRGRMGARQYQLRLRSVSV